MNKTELLRLYQQTQQQLTSGSEEWQTFLTYAARIYKHDFYNAVLAYAQSPDASMLASYDIWHKHASRGVKKGATPVYAYRSGSNPLSPEVSYEPLYDVSHTYGAHGTIPVQWVASKELVEMLEAKNGKSLDAILEAHIQLAYQEELSPAARRLEPSGVDVGQVLRDNALFIKNSVLDLVHRRIGIEEPITIFYDFSGGLRDDIGCFTTAGHLIQRLSRNLLTSLETSLGALEEEPYPVLYVPETVPDTKEMSLSANDLSSAAASLTGEPLAHTDDVLVFKGKEYQVITADSNAILMMDTSDSNALINLTGELALEAAAAVHPPPLDANTQSSEEDIQESFSQDNLLTDEEINGEAPSSKDGIFTVGDTIHLDGTLFYIIDINRYHIRLQDPTLLYPIIRVESHESLIRLLDRDKSFTTLGSATSVVSTIEETEGQLSLTDGIPDYTPHAAIDTPMIVATPPVVVETSTISPPLPATTPAVNYRLPTDFDQSGGQKTKYRQNIAAIRLLKEIEETERTATPEEQEILAKFAGWGGLPQAFDPNNVSWLREYTELSELLTAEEYSHAKTSTLNAHYTSIQVVDAIYAALEQFGYDGKGNLLEPALGIGNFFGRLPDSLSSGRLFGVELDDITGRLARQLYPEASIQICGFEASSIPDDSIDIAIGNVPFGGYTIHDPRFRNLKSDFLIHDYFFAKTLDKLRDGGIMAYITSSGTLDKVNPSTREYLAQRAELLGAIRLPNDTFKGNAGTEVTTDILFFKKRFELLNDLSSIDWLRSFHSEEHGVVVNEYYRQNPQFLLGKLAYSSDMYSQDRTVLLPFADGRSLSELLADAVSLLPSKVYSPVVPLNVDGIEAADSLHILPADISIKQGGYAVVDGIIYRRQDSIMQEIPEQQGKVAERIRGLSEVKTAMHTLLDAQREACSDTTLYRLQQTLGHVYDGFVVKYGYINSPANQRAYAGDLDLHLLSSLETPDAANEGEYLKGAIFSKRVHRAYRAIERVDTAEEALQVSMHETGRIVPSLMEMLYAHPAAEILEQLSKNGLIYQDPEKSTPDEPVWEIAAAYLSGNVRAKLGFAIEAEKSDSRYAANVAALERVIPRNLGPQEIDVRLGAVWFPKEDIANFISGLLIIPPGEISVTREEHSGRWEVNLSLEWRYRASQKNDVTYGSGRLSAIELITLALNQQTPRLYNTDPSGIRVLDQAGTEAAKERLEELGNFFRNWVWEDPARTEKLVSIYNNTFNCLVNRVFDGSELSFPGMNPEVELYPHQRQAVARILYGGQNTLLAHAVGAGKTNEMITAAMELRRIGLAQKPLIVVPNHLLEQWGNDFMRLYPAASILVASANDFESSKRKRLFARIATGDWDAVIVPHSSFEKLAVSSERQQEFIQEELSSLETAISAAKTKRGSRRSIKQLETSLQEMNAKLQKLLDKPKDDLLTFEELGVDYLMVDEAHGYKNLAIKTAMQNVAGINTTGAAKSMDMLLKIRVLSERSSSPRVVFATGTPISNSVTEMYTMLRYLNIGRLTEMGLQQFDDWASVFGESVSAFEVSPTGAGYQSKTRFAKFHNVPELQQLFWEIADVQTPQMLKENTPNWQIPLLETGKRQIISSDRFPALEEYVNSLVMRAEKLRSEQIDPSVDNLLKITSDGRMAALDLRLVDPKAEDNPNSKVNRAISEICAIWFATQDTRLTQAVFCDHGIPGGARFDLYNDMKQKLIAFGIPAEEIAFVHDATTDKQREALFESVRQGKVRIIIGSTAKMGMGTNMQKRLTALHHIDPTWKPAEMEQREGRILRQGNDNNMVRIYAYVTEGTFDAYSYQLLETKAAFIEQIMSGANASRSIEDVDDRALSYAEIKAIASSDPLIKEMYELEAAIKRDELLQGKYLSTKQYHNALIIASPRVIASLTDTLQAIQEDLQRTEEKRGRPFAISIDGYQYDERAEGGKYLLARLYSLAVSGKDLAANPIQIGSFMGFAIYATRIDQIELRGKANHRVAIEHSPHGAVIRMENVLKALPDRIKDLEEKIRRHEADIAAYEEEVEKPFAHSERLKLNRNRRDEIQQLLSVHTVLTVDVVNPNVPPTVTNPSDNVEISPEEQLNNLINHIDKAIEDTFSSDTNYIGFLDCLSRFSKYSFSNLMLIAQQMPEATHLDSSDGWKLKGEREIAPDTHGVSVLKHSLSGDVIGGDEEIAIPTMTVGTLYDISQTLGRDLAPKSNIDYALLYKAIESTSPFAVDVDDSDSSYFDTLDKRIIVGDGLYFPERVAAVLQSLMIGYIAHGMPHPSPQDIYLARDVAYVVTKYYGLPYSGDVSLPSMARPPLSEDKTSEGIELLQRRYLQNVRDFSRDIIFTIDGALKKELVTTLVNDLSENITAETPLQVAAAPDTIAEETIAISYSSPVSPAVVPAVLSAKEEEEAGLQQFADLLQKSKQPGGVPITMFVERAISAGIPPLSTLTYAEAASTVADTGREKQKQRGV